MKDAIKKIVASARYYAALTIDDIKMEVMRILIEHGLLKVDPFNFALDWMREYKRLSILAIEANRTNDCMRFLSSYAEMGEQVKKLA
jgi:hypothetical protein